jgi:hypothetical protein
LRPSAATKHRVTPPPPGSPITPEQIKAAEAYLDAKRASIEANRIVDDAPYETQGELERSFEPILEALYAAEHNLRAAILGVPYGVTPRNGKNCTLRAGKGMAKNPRQ